MRWLVWRKIGAHFWELLSVERDETAKTIYFERCLAQISNAVFKAMRHFHRDEVA